MRPRKRHLKKEFAQKAQSVLPVGIKREQVDLWFHDEARIGQRGTLTRLWARKGSRPRVVRQQQSISAYIFGAFCPARDQSVGLVLPQANTEAMAHQLNALSKVIEPGRHAVVICDQAAWHMTPLLPTPRNISILPLPPYSPELNPAEQVWQQLRNRYLANRCFSDYDDIVEACCLAWNRFTETPNSIRSLCSRCWARL